MKTCPACNGEGLFYQYPVNETCELCKGSGEIGELAYKVYQKILRVQNQKGFKIHKATEEAREARLKSKIDYLESRTRNAMTPDQLELADKAHDQIMAWHISKTRVTQEMFDDWFAKNPGCKEALELYNNIYSRYERLDWSVD